MPTDPCRNPHCPCTHPLLTWAHPHYCCDTCARTHKATAKELPPITHPAGKIPPDVAASVSEQIARRNAALIAASTPTTEDAIAGLQEASEVICQAGVSVPSTGWVQRAWKAIFG